MNRIPIKELSGDAITATPVNRDWRGDHDNAWESFEASRCEKCQSILVGFNGDTHHGIDEASGCDGHVPENVGPMMNYYYPLPEYRGDVDEDARKLVDVPLCIIRFAGESMGLALTGGGMDLSWEICHAHMLLGYLPPAHFSLPEMAGYTLTPTRRWIMAGCRKSARVLLERARWQLRDLRKLSARLAANRE